ncbi:Uncharacterized protein dnm_021950 [Desulfonema magnum]|uniref:Uncharacterized protein n=1 Tax=Desulfonema magnum TaxID=45655 RepID=A0A975GM03_9BACT|nr:Uncharacterized protein dnm_021950 [Desulfonema magnum]
MGIKKIFSPSPAKMSVPGEILLSKKQTMPYLPFPQHSCNLPPSD